ncbi:tripartite-type tricarboxylate transporter receptor subunit TctC [Comamonas sp. BIGb0152]|uniref:tripartite tricarboxylate transporter substrate binding protein n=1 Tax=Comamonas sp. BIGb0152 TaxID=2940601 RepID=UPI002166E022|nr:tripartite tricarboxylate transporter substrate binding protein [Comamonas sp. BIGb0152]MCS4296046.1 tripartite-type tricarboxylate transporter receptor subunit TctC [Comamonas sp. BIGb0152]
MGASLVIPEGQAAPRRPGAGLKILVAYPPGGVSDLVARALAKEMFNQRKVPVIVENRPGASGTLALELLQRSPPDGQTLVLTAAAAVGLVRHAAARRDPTSAATAPLPVQPVAGVMRTPLLLVGTSALEAATFADMIEEARKHPGMLRWATTGEGTTGHTVLQRVSQRAGVRITHVPYKGGGQQLTDALGGHFELLSTNVAPSQLSALRDGRFKALAVGAPLRLPVLPEVPTLAELGYPSANLDSLFGLFAPPGTPSQVVVRLHALIEQALRSPSIRNPLLDANNQPYEGSMQDFALQVQHETDR